jgi:vacuolar-type H+-ATPase subunit F/Vma7
VSAEGLVVVVPSELEAGFHLAGVETVVADDTDEAVARLEQLLAGNPRGVVAVYEPYLDRLPPERLGDLAGRMEPVVVPLPAGLEARDEESHRARISAMLSRAVGYHITFGEEASR